MRANSFSIKRVPEDWKRKAGRWEAESRKVGSGKPEGWESG